MNIFFCFGTIGASFPRQICLIFVVFTKVGRLVFREKKKVVWSRWISLIVKHSNDYFLNLARWFGSSKASMLRDRATFVIVAA